MNNISAGVDKMEFKALFVSGSSGNSYTFTASKKGICILSAYGEGGYFSTTLTQNSTTIASGSTGGSGYGWDAHQSGQYASGWVIKQFPVNSGDSIKFTIGSNGDSGNATRYLIYYII